VSRRLHERIRPNGGPENTVYAPFASWLERPLRRQGFRSHGGRNITLVWAGRGNGLRGSFDIPKFASWWAIFRTHAAFCAARRRGGVRRARFHRRTSNRWAPHCFSGQVEYCNCFVDQVRKCGRNVLRTGPLGMEKKPCTCPLHSKPRPPGRFLATLRLAGPFLAQVGSESI
jgi:hypothetical protein